MNFLRFVSKTLVGLVFVFSGFVKIVDPLGTAYKFGDYFIAMGLDFLIPLALIFSILMCAAEFIIGVMLLINIKTPLASWAALLFMIVFTPLTLWLAVGDPVSDCGCFGDALILSNWETFYKNVVISLLVVVLFINRNKFKPLVNKPLYEYSLFLLIILISIGFEFYNYQHLPIIDFRPYKIGNNISEGMIIPDDAKQPVYESKFIYEKNGQQKTFKLENIPDSTWTFVDSEIKLIEAGYEPPIHDFTIVSKSGEDITYEILEEVKPTFLLIAHNLEKTSTRKLDNINQLAEQLVGSGYRFICMTAALPENYTTFKEVHNLSFDFYNTDEITLKTIVRSNPGLVMIKSGTVLDKWHYNDLPGIDDLVKEYQLSIN